MDERTLTWLSLPSDLGDFALVASGEGLVGVVLPRPGTIGAAVHAHWAGARRGTTPVLAMFAQELRLFLAGGRPGFVGPLDLAGASDYERAVYAVTRTIPHGDTRTYGWLAERAGGSAQAAGNAMASNPIPIIIPCHRVVAAHGLGGFSGGIELKRELLRLEGAAPHGQTELHLAGRRGGASAGKPNPSAGNAR